MLIKIGICRARFGKNPNCGISR